MFSRSRTAAIILWVVVLVGVAALGWAIFSSSGGCVYDGGYGVCSDNTRLKRTVGAVGVLLIVIPALIVFRVTVTRRHQN